MLYLVQSMKEIAYAEGIGYGSKAVEKAQQSAKVELDRIAASF